MFKLALKVQTDSLHNGCRSNVPRHRDRDDAPERDPVQCIAQCDPARLGGQPLSPVWPREPPANFRIRIIAPKAHSAKAHETTASLIDQLPAAKASRFEKTDLAADEIPDLFVGPRSSASDVSHHLGIGGDRTEINPVGGLPAAEQQPRGFKHREIILWRHDRHQRYYLPMSTRRQVLWLPLLTSCRRQRARVIGVVPKATSHLFFLAVHAGVNKAARDAGVEVLWNGPNEETDHARQIQIVDSMVTRRVDALAISATDERALATPVERAIKAGIPVAVFDSGVNVEGYVTFVATDNYAAGCTAARLMNQLCGGSGDVGVVMHKPGGTSTMLRESGFDETIAREAAGLRVVARQYGMSDRAKARAVAENILTAHPRISGLFASSEASSLGAIQAVAGRGLGGKVKVITFDTSDSHIEALQRGIIDAMLVQDSFRLGYQAVKALVDKLEGRTPSRRLDVPAVVVRRADLGSPETMALLKPRLD